MSHTFTLTVTDEEYKAFNLMVRDADKWVVDAIKNRIRKCGIQVAEAHAKDPSLYLTPEDKSAIKSIMEANGDLMKEPKNWSVATLREIVRRTTMPPLADRELSEDPTPQP